MKTNLIIVEGLPGSGKSTTAAMIAEELKKKRKFMSNKGKTILLSGVITLILFGVWTALIQTVDVQPSGQNGTNIGFAALNLRFHELTGVNLTLYSITDWLGLVPIAVCMIFAVLGAVQLFTRRSLLKVDTDILLLGIYYIIVIFCYLVFEMIPINYRPIPIDGFMEASYPSSTTLLVLSVMPTLIFQSCRRIRRTNVNYMIYVFTALFSLFMVTGRTVAGVHWLTDIIGSVLLSAGLYLIYHGSVVIIDKKKLSKEKTQ